MNWPPERELSIRLEAPRAEGPPNRQLVLDVKLQNGSAVPIVVLSAVVQMTIKSVKVAFGNLFEHSTARTGPATILPNQTGYGTIRIPLSFEALLMIEDRRLGNDVDWQLQFDARIGELSESGFTNIRDVLARGDGGDSYNRSVIPQSEWLKLLSHLGYQETAVIELPHPNHPLRFPIARAHLDDAITQYRRGEWKPTFAACRAVFESLADSKSLDKSARPDLKRLREHFDKSEKGETMDKLTYELGRFLHLGRHVPGSESGVHITPLDAHFALVTTAELLRYCERCGNT